MGAGPNIYSTASATAAPPEPLSNDDAQQDSSNPAPSRFVRVSAAWRGIHGRNAFGANAALSAATNLALAALGMTSGILAARLLGPRGRGELAAIQTWPMLIGYLSVLGLGDALIYYAAREREHAGMYLGSAVSLTALVSGPIILLAYFVIPFALSAQPSSVITAARWYLLIIPLVPLQMLPFSLFRGLGEFGVWNLLRLCPPLCWLLILVGAWLASSYSPSRLANLFLVAMLLVVFLQAFVVRQRVGRVASETKTFVPLLRYGLPCILSTLPQLLNLRLDQMVMTIFLPPVALGLYVVAVAWAGAINPLLTAMAAAQFPEVAAKLEWAERARAFLRGTRLAALMALLTGLVLTIATPWAIKLLFGPRFSGAVPSGLILVPAGAVAGVNGVIEDGLRGLGRPALVMRAEMTGLVVTIICLATMLRPLGILGAAIASLLGYSTVGISLLVSACRITGCSVGDLLIPGASEIQSYCGHVRQMLLHAREVLHA